MQSRKPVTNAKIKALQSSLIALEGIATIAHEVQAERREGETQEQRQVLLSAATHLTEAQCTEARAASTLAIAEKLREKAIKISRINPNANMSDLEKAQEETEAKRKELEMLLASKKEGQ
ncbi:MAG: hypothetical protein PVI40_08505 [Chlamydiota bacterium]|jgi:hypothetical protein